MPYNFDKITYNTHMKKVMLLCLLCVIFLFSNLNFGVVYAFQNEKIEFITAEKVFEYNLSSNIKQNEIFSINHEINKHHRFGSFEERKNLLSKMLNCGFDKSVALEYLFPNLNKKINSIAKNVYIAPQNASLHVLPNTEKVFHTTKEVVGQELDKDTLINQICFAYLNEKKLTFALPLKTLNPTITSKQFMSTTNLRSDFSTNISSSSLDRKHNIKNALNSLNKLEIMPNHVFSFNKAVGRRTAENGYRQAKIIVNNEFVEGIGGGVCQVSSTLYNSALLAGLEIIEANKHSKQVHYVPYGFDAMVNFGSSDLKFKNNTNEKLTIITNMNDSTIRIRVFGEDLKNVKYKLSNEVFNIQDFEEEIIFDEKQEYSEKVKFDDEYFTLKTGSKGMEINSYRETYINGTLTEKELVRHDKFKVQNAVKVFGTTPRYNLLENLKN